MPVSNLSIHPIAVVDQANSYSHSRGSRLALECVFDEQTHQVTRATTSPSSISTFLPSKITSRDEIPRMRDPYSDDIEVISN
jgi:hypothetical protein